MPSPYDHVTVAPSLSQKEILISSRDDDDQAKIISANRCNSHEESLPKNRDIFARKHSQAVKRTRRGEDASSNSVSEVIQFHQQQHHKFISLKHTIPLRLPSGVIK